MPSSKEEYLIHFCFYIFKQKGGSEPIQIYCLNSVSKPTVCHHTQHTKYGMHISFNVNIIKP